MKAFAFLAVLSVLTAACTIPTVPAPGANDQPSSQNELAPGFVPDPSDAPDNATAIPSAMEVGLDDGTPRRPDGSMATTSVRCEQAMMYIETTRGTYIARVPRAGDWGCPKALEQVQQSVPAEGRIGLRYVGAGGQDEQLTMISSAGTSVTFRVAGLWQGS